MEQAEQWQLEASYRVRCIHCYHVDEACQPTQEEALACLKSVGWAANEVGMWCPECTPMLYARSGRTHKFAVGDIVVDVCRGYPFGPILRIGEGYIEVKMPDGFPSVFCPCEVVKKK